MTRTKEKTIKIAICAIMIALGTALSFIKLYDSPLGGSVTLFSMTPILFIGFKYGPAWGFSSAFVYSILQLLFGLSAVTYVPTPTGVAVCIILDYIIAFTVLGITGFYKRKKINLLTVIIGSLNACILRFISHFLCGGIIWYEITKNGAWNDTVFKYSKWMYSFIYQCSYLAPETILVLAAATVILFTLKYSDKY